MSRYQSIFTRAAIFCSFMALSACDIGPSELSSKQSAVTYAQNTQCVTLLAGQTINAGSVCMTVSGQDLVATYNTTNGWQLNEVHLWVGDSLSTMPQTKNGNPQIGLFPYTAQNLNGATSYTFNIPLSSLGSGDLCDHTFLAAAHASVQKPNGSGGFESQTGWGAGSQLNQRGSWAMYYSYTVLCTTPPPPTTTSLTCETGYALGSTTFVNLGLTRDRWGWQSGPLAPGSYTQPIYAGAAQNDTSKGKLVGQALITYDGSVVKVNYTMQAGYVLDATHVYAGTSSVSTISPGQYGNTHDPLSNVSSDSFSIGGFSGEPVYVVVHGVVCH